MREGVKMTAGACTKRRPGVIRRWARAAWRALPGDLVGAAAARLAGTRSRRQVEVRARDGVVQCRAVVVEDARLGRWLELMPLRPEAMTFGRYVLARRSIGDPILRHELEHVRQWARLGPLFLPAYLFESVRARAAGEDRYRGNRFEVAARACEGAAGASGDDASSPGALTREAAVVEAAAPEAAAPEALPLGEG